MLIASLTSIPPRFDRIGATLESLLGQNHAPDRILLYIADAYTRFPDWDGALPVVPSGVEIRHVPDYGPATKLLGALKDFWGQEVSILFCDDDRIYDPNLTRRVLKMQSQHPGCCIAENGYHLERYGIVPAQSRQPRAKRRMRITDWRFQLAYAWQHITNWSRRFELREPPRRCNRRAGYVDVFEGSGGALVRPEMFDDAVFDVPDAVRSVDDIWLSGNLEKKGVPIWLPANILEQEFSAAEEFSPLSGGVNDDGVNRQAVEYLQKELGIWAVA